MNTDYHHGDRPLGLFWCCGQMKTSDQEHLLMGRVRSWDGLIVLRRLPVSPLLLISHHPPPPPLPSFLIVWNQFLSIIYFPFVGFIEFPDLPFPGLRSTTSGRLSQIVCNYSRHRLIFLDCLPFNLPRSALSRVAS